MAAGSSQIMVSLIKRSEAPLGKRQLANFFGLRVEGFEGSLGGDSPLVIS